MLGKGKALRYGIGTAKDGFEWSGTHQITRKAEWPGWTPPAEMKQRRPDLPDYMPGGLNNPLGARALYIGGDALPHPRHQRALDHRRRCKLGMHPDGQ